LSYTASEAASVLKSLIY